MPTKDETGAVLIDPNTEKSQSIAQLDETADHPGAGSSPISQEATGREEQAFFVENDLQPAVIKVIGVGGGGGNAVQHMLDKKLGGVEFIAINTDVQALATLSLENKLAIGSSITGGLGAGANPEVGKQAALEDADRINAALEGAHMVFIAAGMGGGTGTGAAPEVARLAREKNILTVAVVTRPFGSENRDRTAEEGLNQLRAAVDSLIVISNDNLLKMSSGKLTVMNAFATANGVLHGAVEGIADLVLKSGVINVDFADVRTVMQEMGSAMMGTGQGSGGNRAQDATKQAIDCPLLDGVDMKGAKGVLVNITSGPELGMDELEEILAMVRERAAEDATIIRGWVMDPDMDDDALKVTIVTTGLGEPRKKVKAAHRPMQISKPPNYSDLDIPTFQRGQRDGKGSQPAAGNMPQQAPAGPAEPDYEWLDVPQFLRQQAD